LYGKFTESMVSTLESFLFRCATQDRCLRTLPGPSKIAIFT
jgi:hypothetical protein